MYLYNNFSRNMCKSSVGLNGSPFDVTDPIVSNTISKGVALFIIPNKNMMDRSAIGLVSHLSES